MPASRACSTDRGRVLDPDLILATEVPLAPLTSIVAPGTPLIKGRDWAIDVEAETVLAAIFRRWSAAGAQAARRCGATHGVLLVSDTTRNRVRWPEHGGARRVRPGLVIDAPGVRRGESPGRDASVPL